MVVDTCERAVWECIIDGIDHDHDHGRREVEAGGHVEIINPQRKADGFMTDR